MMRMMAPREVYKPEEVEELVKKVQRALKIAKEFIEGFKRALSKPLHG
ncbi:MAG: hypothetical protein QW145_03260 [Candidatus Bathyarchaeia archaeon]